VSLLPFSGKETYRLRALRIPRPVMHFFDNLSGAKEKGGWLSPSAL
jgi:hypothetical protein